MVFFPIVAGFQLSPRELQLLEVWLSGYDSYQSRKEIRPGDLVEGLNFYPAPNQEALKDLLGWCRPLILVAGQKAQESDLKNLFEQGISAIWKFPEPGAPFLFPAVQFPDFENSVILVSDHEPLRHKIRSVLAFAQLDLRTDFRRGEEIIQFLKDSTQADTPLKSPKLLIIDLDGLETNVPGLLNFLQKSFSMNPEYKNRLPVMLIKDFSLSGVDVAALAPRLKFFTRRIFHPLEGLLALVESNLLYKNSPDKAQTNIPLAGDLYYSRPPFRSIHQFLYGKEAEVFPSTPQEWRNFMTTELKTLSLGAPFLWLFDLYRQTERTGGAVLKMQDGSGPE